MNRKHQDTLDSAKIGLGAAAFTYLMYGDVRAAVFSFVLAFVVAVALDVYVSRSR